MNVSDTVDYDIHRVEDSVLKDSSDCIAIEEPLEIAVHYFKNDEWIVEPLMVTMRTPGDDESLVSGLLFSEGIIQDKAAIDKIVPNGENEGKYDIDNSLIVTLTKGNQLDLKNLQRHFMVNSSCGVCGKTSLDSLEIIKKDKIVKSLPKIDHKIIMKSPTTLRENQSEFSKTGGIHASGLFSDKGDVVAIKEDVGRHNALDKSIGYVLKKKLLNSSNQFLTCSGRLNFELVQKALMSNIGVLIGVGAPTSLAIDLANKFDMTLVGFVKQDSFNIYSNKERIVIKS